MSRSRGFVRGRPFVWSQLAFATLVTLWEPGQATSASDDGLGAANASRARATLAQAQTQAQVPARANVQTQPQTQVQTQTVPPSQPPASQAPAPQPPPAGGEGSPTSLDRIRGGLRREIHLQLEAPTYRTEVEGHVIELRNPWIDESTAVAGYVRTTVPRPHHEYLQQTWGTVGNTGRQPFEVANNPMGWVTFPIVPVDMTQLIAAGSRAARHVRGAMKKREREKVKARIQRELQAIESGGPPPSSTPPASGPPSPAPPATVQPPSGSPPSPAPSNGQSPSARPSSAPPSSAPLDLPPASFDLAYSSLALHYIGDLARLFAIVHTALVPAGAPPPSNPARSHERPPSNPAPSNPRFEAPMF